MIKRFFKRIKLNFRQSNSDRKATNSYRLFGRYIKAKFNRFKFEDRNIIKSKLKSQNSKVKVKI